METAGHQWKKVRERICCVRSVRVMVWAARTASSAVIVSKTHAWLNRWRRVQTRWEKRLGHYAAFVELAICMLIWRNIRLKSA